MALLAKYLYNVTSFMGQALVHIVLRDLTHYYWYKAELEEQNNEAFQSQKEQQICCDDLGCQSTENIENELQQTLTEREASSKTSEESIKVTISQENDLNIPILINESGVEEIINENVNISTGKEHDLIGNIDNVEHEIQPNFTIPSTDKELEIKILNSEENEIQPNFSIPSTDKELEIKILNSEENYTGSNSEYDDNLILKTCFHKQKNEKSLYSTAEKLNDLENMSTEENIIQENVVPGDFIHHISIVIPDDLQEPHKECQIYELSVEQTCSKEDNETLERKSTFNESNCSLNDNANIEQILKRLKIPEDKSIVISKIDKDIKEIMNTLNYIENIGQSEDCFENNDSEANKSISNDDEWVNKFFSELDTEFCPENEREYDEETSCKCLETHGCLQVMIWDEKDDCQLADELVEDESPKPVDAILNDADNVSCSITSDEYLKDGHLADIFEVDDEDEDEIPDEEMAHKDMAVVELVHESKQELLTDDQLQSVETGSVSDWLYKVNPSLCLLGASDGSTNFEEQSIRYNILRTSEYEENIIKALYTHQWLNDLTQRLPNLATNSDESINY